MDGIGEVVLGILIALLLQVYESTCGIDVGIVLVDLERGLEVGKGSHGILLLYVHLSTHVECRGIAWHDAHDGVEHADGGIILLEVGITEGEVVPQTLILGGMAQGVAVVANGLGILALVDTCKSAQLVAIDHKGIATDGLGAVGLCTGKIVQIELRQATIEVGLVQVGLGIHHLVKVLNGEYVVAEVKRIATDPHHVIGVHLRLG